MTQMRAARGISKDRRSKRRLARGQHLLKLSHCRHRELRKNQTLQRPEMPVIRDQTMGIGPQRAVYKLVTVRVR